MQTDTALEILQGRQVVLQGEIKAREKELEAVNVAVQAIIDANRFEGIQTKYPIDIDGRVGSYDDIDKLGSKPGEF